MNLKIFLALMLPFMAMAASAQNPILKKFIVEYRTADGVETAVEVATISAANSFGFIGSKGKVDYYNEATGQWESIEEENSDVYLNVTKVDAYSAKLAASFSYNIEEVSFDINTYGYCISKTPNPQASDSYIKISSGGTVNLQQYFEENGDGCYTLIISNGSKISNSAVEVNGLDYVTTYYVRPFIKFYNGFIMYGGEKSFTTVKTMDAALASEEGLEESVRLEDSIVVTKKALSSLIDNEEEISIDLRYGVEQDFTYLVKSMSSADKAELLKNVNKTIECVDGNLYVINECPAGIIETFKKNFGGGVEFSAVEMFKSVISGEDYTAYCDASLGVPYNSYILAQPISSSGNPTIELNIPKYLHAGKEYDIYAVFVHSDITGDTLPNKFIIELQERQPSSESGEKGSYKRTHKSDDYINNASNSVDTCFVGRYTFLGTPDPIIQIYSDVSRREKEYSRIICISKICIVPVNENE